MPVTPIAARRNTSTPFYILRINFTKVSIKITMWKYINYDVYVSNNGCCRTPYCCRACHKMYRFKLTETFTVQIQTHTTLHAQL